MDMVNRVRVIAAAFVLARLVLAQGNIVHSEIASPIIMWVGFPHGCHIYFYSHSDI